MLKILQERVSQGSHTMRYPDGPAPVLPGRFRGLPVISSEPCLTETDQKKCTACVQCCPTSALTLDRERNISLDLGRCLFCAECQDVCPAGHIIFSHDHRLSTRKREDLFLHANQELTRAAALDKKMKRIFGRSLKLRQVSAAGCNACEADVNVLSTIGWDIGRFGIQMVASPRHADGILVTGCVSENMRVALQKTYEAVPAPKVVIAVGACAISGGPFAMNPQQHGGAGSIVPIDLFIPGCPPHPLTILDGLLRLLGRLEEEGRTP